jgi:hypothetical protein
MKIVTCIPLLFVCSLACNNAQEQKAGNKESETKAEIKFDTTKWSVRKENNFSQPEYPYRNEMLKDLIDHYHLKGLKKDELIDLLGKPDHTDSGYMFYLVAQKRIYFFPLRTKTLVIKLASDSTVEWRKIHGR